MRKNLATTGLSMSQAQSVSNLCNQRAISITNKLKAINNATKTLKWQGENMDTVKGTPIPNNIIELLLEQARLRGAQAFLMENIKLKEQLLNKLQTGRLEYKVPVPEIERIKTPEYMEDVDLTWGWQQLTKDEYNEYLEQEAQAAHLGQFIHSGGVLDKLRIELAELPALEWFSVKEGELVPVQITPHHTTSDLEDLHEKVAALHRKAEQRVNYYKAKVQNLVTTKNLEVQSYNSKLLAEYRAESDLAQEKYTQEYEKWVEERKAAVLAWDIQKSNDIKEISALRIQIDARFKEIIDSFLITD